MSVRCAQHDGTGQLILAVFALLILETATVAFEFDRNVVRRQLIELKPAETVIALSNETPKLLIPDGSADRTHARCLFLEYVQALLLVDGP